MIRCPCCNGKGEIEEKSPVKLSPMQFRIYDFVRRAGEGIEGTVLVKKIYATDPDGGPLCAMESMYVTINNANKKLLKAAQKIQSSGSGLGAVYRLVHL